MYKLGPAVRIWKLGIYRSEFSPATRSLRKEFADRICVMWGADRIWQDIVCMMAIICSVSFRRNLHSCWNRCVSGGFAMETMLFEHKCCRQSFSLKVVGWNGTYCLLSSWVLVVKNVQHQQHHAEYQQNTSNQLAWRNVVFTMFLFVWILF